MLKIIFLGIDGILCTTRAYFSNGYKYGNKAYDPISVGLINYLCDCTKAKIVISSSWRLDITPFNLCNMLQLIGLNNIYFYKKDNLKAFVTPILRNNFFRGNEIKNWIKKYGPINRYICIDRDNDFHLYQPLIKISEHNGISFENYMGAEDYLLGKKKKLFGKDNIVLQTALEKHLET